MDHLDPIVVVSELPTMTLENLARRTLTGETVVTPWDRLMLDGKPLPGVDAGPLRTDERHLTAKWRRGACEIFRKRDPGTVDKHRDKFATCVHGGCPVCEER